MVRMTPERIRFFAPPDDLATYTFNTHTARDYFCPTCGILPFRRPRTAPGEWSVNVRCLDGVDLDAIPVKRVYGSRRRTTRRLTSSRRNDGKDAGSYSGENHMRFFKLGLAFAGLVVLSGGAIAADWHVEPLPANLPLANQSCLTRYGIAGKSGDADIFLDESTDDKARANIKLAGKVFDLTLVSSKTSGKDGPDTTGVGMQMDRVFKDKTGAVAVESVVKVTAVHPDADSSEMAGTLTAKYLGRTQTIKIAGGVAC